MEVRGAHGRAAAHRLGAAVPAVPAGPGAAHGGGGAQLVPQGARRRRGGPLHYSDENPDGEFHLTEQDTGAEALATWHTEIEVARRYAAGFGLAEFSRGRSRFTDEAFSLRWIYTHMIEEYARHNGHADLIRERIDGSTGE